MHCGQMLFVFVALLALAYSYPTGSEQKSADSAPYVTNTTNNAVPENKKPETIIVKDEQPQTESVVVEFIYNSNGGNSISESRGKDKDKYNVESSLQKGQTQNLNENEKLTPKITSTEAPKQVNEPRFDLSQKAKDLYMKAQMALAPEEASPITENWPKYFYDAFNPIQPFPEMQYDKQNRISAQKVNRENTDSYISYNEKEKLMHVAGPLLSPLSIYEREFRVPTFD